MKKRILYISLLCGLLFAHLCVIKAETPPFTDTNRDCVDIKSLDSILGNNKRVYDFSLINKLDTTFIYRTNQEKKSYLSEFLVPGNKGRMFSRFGRRWGRMHRGNDIKMNRGDTVVAVQSGTIIRSKWVRGFGYLIVIQHKNDIQTYYGHISKFLKKKGSKIEKGEAIALAGSTGNARGPHLHFEIHEKGRSFDPELIYDFKHQKIKENVRKGTTLASLQKQKSPSKNDFNRKTASSKYYKVRKGDSLWVISRKFNTSVTKICRLNRISKHSLLQVGQRLRIA